jgi:hypothetical protein
MTRGVTTFEILLILLLVVFVAGAALPPFLAARAESQREECALRLAAIQEAKRDVMKEMNLRLPHDVRMRITDKVNALHLDMIAEITLASPWRFRPEDPCPDGGIVSVGETFLDPPSCSSGVPIGNLGETP